MTLIERLVRLAELWASSQSRSMARLATIVVNDGKLFERLSSGSSCTVATLERFVTYLSDAANWQGTIPAEATDLLQSLRADHRAAPEAAAA